MYRGRQIYFLRVVKCYPGRILRDVSLAGSHVMLLALAAGWASLALSLGAAPLREALGRLGIGETETRQLVQYCVDEAISWDEASIRMGQLLHGVERDFVTRDAAVRLVQEQPAILRCEMVPVYEDEHLLLVEKPCDVRLRLPSDAPEKLSATEPSVHEWLRARHPAVVTSAGTTRVCHNLDFATSGVLACAKSEVAAREVSRLFAERGARKLYAALVFGHPEWDERNVSAKILVSARKFRQSVTKSAAGKSARTTATVAARGKLLLGPHRGRDASLVWLTPHTGRRHQLRVHMAHIGYPIVGDFTYASDPLPYRMFLHAAALELPVIGLGRDGSPVRALAPLSPHGWRHAFEPTEPVRSPAGWPDAARLLAGALLPTGAV